MTIPANYRRKSYLATKISKQVAAMCRHFDQEEREIDGSRHLSSTIPVLMRKFAQDGARDFK